MPEQHVMDAWDHYLDIEGTWTIMIDLLVQGEEKEVQEHLEHQGVQYEQTDWVEGEWVGHYLYTTPEPCSRASAILGAGMKFSAIMRDFGLPWASTGDWHIVEDID
jgi:hypothetical protein